MDKTKVALAVSVIVCVILAGGLVAAIVNYQNIIQQQNKEIENQNKKMSDLEDQIDFYKRIILEFIDMGKLANDSIEEAFFRALR